MAAYSVCFILVLSFICFEVLDIDGSDFAGPMRAAATIKATDPPGDLRRAPLQTAIPTRRDSRSTLARSLLADPAPSA